ncbi:hypothetical protein PDL71_15370 [Lacibacter sp. MH-610]|uniref:hypothetical protein n=1 Tax=Lacibacter sp. MH-610 TaxID=3020883 RepID=UPI0038920C69
MIITYLLIFLAAAMNAIMDRTENIVAFNRSVFSHADKRFWCKEISWQYAAKVFGWKADVWHIAKSSMIILLAFAMVFFESTGHWWLDILAIGAAWNGTFNLFYHKILYR